MNHSSMILPRLAPAQRSSSKLSLILECYTRLFLSTLHVRNCINCYRHMSSEFCNVNLARLHKHLFFMNINLFLPKFAYLPFLVESESPYVTWDFVLRFWAWCSSSTLYMLSSFSKFKALIHWSKMSITDWQTHKLGNLEQYHSHQFFLCWIVIEKYIYI